MKQGRVCCELGKCGPDRSDPAKIVPAGQRYHVIVPQLHSAAKLLGEFDISGILIDFWEPLPFADALRQTPGAEYATRRAQRGFGIPGYVFHLVSSPNDNSTPIV